MKAVILARVSTEEQKEAGNSLPAQQHRLWTYIERKPELVHDKEYVFDESAYKEHRKELDNVIDYLVSQKEVVALCCDKVDRLTRDFLVGLPRLEKLRRDGKIELHFPSDNLILHKDSPATDLFHFNIAVSLAQYYSNSISDNVKRSYEKMRREGVWVSQAPFGYKRDTDIEKKTTTIIPDPERAHIVSRMFELYATGNYSLEKLLQEALKMGLESKGGKKPPRSCIEKMLKNSFYYGVAVSDKCAPYPHNYTRLTTFELFERCKEIREGKNHNRPKFLSKDFIFKGLLRCPHCDCLLSPEMHKKPSGLIFVYYACTNAKGTCKRTYVSEKTLLKPIYDIFERFEKLTNEDKEYLVKKLRQNTEAEIVFHRAQMNRISTEMERLEQKDDNLLEALLDKSITKDIYDKKHQQNGDKKQLLNIEMEEHTKANHDYQTTVATVYSLAQRAKDIFESSETDEKRAFLNYLLQNPTVQEKELVFSLRSPFNLVLEWADCPKMGGYWESNPD